MTQYHYQRMVMDGLEIKTPLEVRDTTTSCRQYPEGKLQLVRPGRDRVRVTVTLDASLLLKLDLRPSQLSASCQNRDHQLDDVLGSSER